MKTHISNHSRNVPLEEDLWLLTANQQGTSRLDNDDIERSITNLSRTKDTPEDSQLQINTIMIWRVPKGTKKNLYHQDPREELIQWVIERSDRIVLEVRFCDSDGTSHLYRVGKAGANGQKTELIQWTPQYTVDALAGEILDSDSVIHVARQFMKRTDQRVPEGYVLRELIEFLIEN